MNLGLGAPVCGRLWVRQVQEAGCKPALRFMEKKLKAWLRHVPRLAPNADGPMLIPC
jgi:hypothetical protein